MAGGYTHLTLARELCTTASNDLGQPGLQGVLATVVSNWRDFVFLGAVSPDYPYFGKGTPWADRMHKEKTNGIIIEGVQVIRAMRDQAPSGITWEKCMAWLLGYASHVVADVVIHPIVNLKVGVYEKNKDKHRECEMHQDARIYKERVGLDLHLSHEIVQEVQACNDPGVDYADLDDEIESVWSTCLLHTYGQAVGDYAIDFWHAGFVSLVSIAERAGKVPLIGRYFMDSALAYPRSPQDLDAGKEYYFDLDTPLNGMVGEEEQPIKGAPLMHFPDIFNKAARHARDTWLLVAGDVVEGTSRSSEKIGDWSLDTGVDRGTGRLHFWS